MSIHSQKRNKKHAVQKRRHRAVLCRLVFAVCVFITSVATASGPSIGDIEIRGLHSIEKREFLSLLDILPGEPADADTVRFGIKRAFLKGMFEDIAVEITEGEKAKAVISVKERDGLHTAYRYHRRLRSFQKNNKDLVFFERRADPDV